ncbi:MAG: GntR family transcriptional regulator [Limnobacter sp.]|nr:GntR family transcriptional regulator [Limnobacter sp.]
MPARGPANAINTSDRIAGAIGIGILKRRYRIGQRLVEADLMHEFGVGRSTVREALKTLAGTGVVELIPHRGAVIRALNRSDAEDLLQVLEVLCGLAARLAAMRIGVGDNRRLFEDASAALLSAAESEGPRRMLDLRARFYQTMFDIADNVELKRAMPSTRAHLFRSQMYEGSTLSDLEAMAAEYRGITEAILAGDAKKAELRARQHIENTAARSLPRIPAG